jgi:DNA-binding NarL/FixJ family response regulator
MTELERRGGPAELHLDYGEIAGGQVVIVIRGLPAGVERASSVALERAAPHADCSVRAPKVASPLITEAQAIHDATAYAPDLVTSLMLAAWRGQEARASELIAATIEDAPTGDARRAGALADYARAVLYNGLGRYEEALAAAARACVHDDLGSFAWALLELVEAGTRCDARGLAAQALDQLEVSAGANDSDWALGVRARSAALVSDGARAEDLYRQAIDLLARGGNAIHLARAQLVYGEWLRRENRRVDARAQLRAAHDTFARLAAQAFAQRALRELLATGETARKRTDDARAFLTPQEAEIARLAQDGLSNPEIGARLFISPRTVQYHLRKVFAKLDISSRRQLWDVPDYRLAPAHP